MGPGVRATPNPRQARSAQVFRPLCGTPADRGTLRFPNKENRGPPSAVLSSSSQLQITPSAPTSCPRWRQLWHPTGLKPLQVFRARLDPESVDAVSLCSFSFFVHRPANTTIHCNPSAHCFSGPPAPSPPAPSPPSTDRMPVTPASLEGEGKAVTDALRRLHSSS